MAFAHLHLHTEYSLLDGACKINELVKKLKQIDQKHCAITDHGAMYGAVDFYNACKKEGIHPVIGCEVYVCQDMYDKTSNSRSSSHLILLCENETGYKNLSKLLSYAFIDGYYYRPRFDYKMLQKYSEGLIALSACIFGELPQLLLNNQYEEAKGHILFMQSIFGKNNYFIEIMNHGIKEELIVLPKLKKIAIELNVPMVATNDCHYINASDAPAQEVLMCIQTGKTLDDPDRMRMVTDQLYVKSEAEMLEVFKDVPEAIEMSVKIAERCKYDFTFGRLHLPKYKIDTDETPEQMLKRLCLKGLFERYGNADTNSPQHERLIYELDMIAQMGYVDYFIIVWDFINYAKSVGIPVGPGRGSGSGSIVAYTLYITAIDPIKYNLLFERFLNPERLSMPDLDIDFCYVRRQEVIDYVSSKYGTDHVAQIITFDTMAARGAIRDVGRVMGVNKAKVDKLAKMIPAELEITLNRAFELNPKLLDEYENDTETKQLFDMSRIIEGMPRHSSTHAAGVLISAKPVTEYLPLQKNNDVITTQFPMGIVESLGLLKMDFLGLKTLTVIRETLDMLPNNAPKIEDDIPIDDKETFEMISKGDTDGVFQLESRGMKEFLQNMKPECFEDIIAAISLYRPGPMDSIPKYIKGKQNPQNVEYAIPQLKQILEVSYGCIVYQEQVMQIVRALAGYSYGRSDLVRRAMSKKKKDIMQQEREYFINGMVDDNGNIIVPGCVRNGIQKDIASNIFDDISSFASYGFNKSHAAPYGLLSVQTAWLKKHYPSQFMASVMNNYQGNTGKITSYVQNCKDIGIKIMAPNINKSLWKFSVDQIDDNNVIWFGLSAVKNIGQNTVNDIIECRKYEGFKSIYNFIKRMSKFSINKKAVESLIKAGAFDGLGYNRTQMLMIYEKEMDVASYSKNKNVQGQTSMFDILDQKETEVPTEILNVSEMPKLELLKFEKEITGIYISGHPMDEYMDKLEGFDRSIDLIELANEPDKGVKHDGLKVKLAGVLVYADRRATKKGQLMGLMALEDIYGKIEGLVFPKVFDIVSPYFFKDNLVYIEGKMMYKEDEEIKIIVDSMDSLSQYNNTSSIVNKTKTKLYLKINSSDIQRLMRILSNYKGRIPVCVKFIDVNKAIILDKEYWCDANSMLLDTLSANFGGENILVQQ